jgi:hypothetical protein
LKDITLDYFLWETERKNDRKETKAHYRDDRLAQVLVRPEVFSVHMKLLKIQAQECVRPPCTQQDSLPERIPEHTLLSSTSLAAR